MAASSEKPAGDVPWEVIYSNDEQGQEVGWHKMVMPYVPNHNALQTVDVWVPQLREKQQGQPVQSSANAPKRSAFWLIYIHGGAWRDPLVTSSSFEPTIRSILAGQPDLRRHIAGFASINYSLSPHPNHPTLPAPVPAPGVDTDPSRSAQHPGHIRDVLSAIGFLDRKFDFGSNYVLTGHSCGATLALQVAMDRKLWSSVKSEPSPAAPKPAAIVGLNGLYDLPALIDHPGEKHQKLAKEYENFTKLAFGDHKIVWSIVSPTSVANWSKDWTEGKQIVLVQSHEDTLVPYSQTTIMFKSLRASASHGLQISEMDASGDHNDLWHNGDRIAQVLDEVLQRLI